MNNRSEGRRMVNRLLFGALGFIASGNFGCHMYSNPFADPFVGTPKITTASSVGAMEEARESSPGLRSFSEEKVAMADGSVTHGPLFFEDWLGDSVEDDGEFSWTGEDYLTIFTWRARYLLNLALIPVSAIDTPPWCAMRSDGRPSRRILWKDHDAAKVPNQHGPCHRCETALRDAPS